MTKLQQDNIKDVGGFVGGNLKNGSRKSENVLDRTILTLDVDFADSEFLEHLRCLTSYTYIAYSTHKHTRDAPRLRLVLPLDRPCSAEEYEAVARAIAFDIGIDFFDDSTYQAHRLMYYPSTSYDGEYLFESSKGVDVCVDMVLSTYKDWRDVSSWHTSSRTLKKHQSLIKKQECPETKKGIVGAFCRTYTVAYAIQEFLSDVYTPCEGNRYTFTSGSTSGGAILYDDGNFLYSNHATDPAGGVLCNAFDLIRIHKFQHLDEDISDKTIGKNLPSYKKMIEFVQQDKEVKKIIQKERFEQAKENFNEFKLCAEENNDWITDLELDGKGNNLPTIDNIKKILKHDNNLKNHMRFNEFTKKYKINGAIPWGVGDSERDWTDTDDAGLRHYLERAYGIKQKSNIIDAWLLNAKENRYHPVRSYLENLVWDRVPRVETLFIDYLGAQDTPYIRSITRKVLAACVARVFVPGIKFDLMPVLIGEQGCGKSLILKKLGREWFSDTLNSMNDKGAYEQIQGSWVIEIAELSAMRKTDVESIKHFISKSEDVYRGAYAKHVESYKRQCVFFGTTNTHDFLSDMTGNRRFLPIDVCPKKATKTVWDDLSNLEVDQIWAEAVEIYKMGEKLYLDDEAIKRQAELEQDKHLDFSPLQGDIESYLECLLPENWKSFNILERRNYLRGTDFTENVVGTVVREKVCIMEIWCELLGGEKKDLTRSKSNEIKDIITKNGNWVRCEKNVKSNIYGVQKMFYKKNLNY